MVVINYLLNLVSTALLVQVLLWVGSDVFSFQIANSGIVGGCHDICSGLPAAAERTICEAGCLAVGIDELVQVLEKADIDPIWCVIVLKSYLFLIPILIVSVGTARY